MIDFLFLDQNTPYLFSLGFILLLGLFEGLALLIGLSVAGLLDDISPFSVDTAGMDGADLNAGGLSSIVGWLCLDRLPMLIWLVVFLSSFSILGLTFNFTAISLTTHPIPTFIGIVLVLIVSLVLTAKIGARIANLVPQTQSSAIYKDSFVGQKALIMSSLAKQGSAAEASFVDEHKQKHYVMVEPLESQDEFKHGQEVVLVEKTPHCWKAIPYESVV